MTLRQTIRSVLLPRDQIAKEIGERVRCCPRPDWRPLDCPRSETNSDYRYWERISTRLLSFQPDNPDGWIVLGHSRFQLCDLEGACKAYRVAARLRDDVATWYSLGLCSTGNERVVACHTALRLKSDDAMSWHLLGNALKDAGDYEQAIQCLKTATDYSGPESAAWVLCDLGLCHMSTHDREDSITAFERSIRADGGYAFNTMAANIADACLAESPEFACALHLRLRTLYPYGADFFLRCFNTRLAGKNAAGVQS
jgi:tetratricopeptide (TPR) repeat protein